MRIRAKEYTVVIRVRSRTGARPKVRALGGDTLFVYMEEGMSASMFVRDGRWQLAKKVKHGTT